MQLWEQTSLQGMGLISLPHLLGAFVFLVPVVVVSSDLSETAALQ